MTFVSREAAGRQLAWLLRNERVEVDVVLGLPRGGVVVAAEVARLLGKPLDALVVRKIGHPLHREFAVGALAEPGVVLLDELSLQRFPAPKAELDRVIGEEIQRLKEYRKNFHRHARVNLTGKKVLIVDDGLATGATAEAAGRSARQQGATAVIVGTPVASANATRRLLQCADDVKAVVVDPTFSAVGQYYEHFDQTTTEEVIALLAA